MAITMTSGGPKVKGPFQAAWEGLDSSCCPSSNPSIGGYVLPQHLLYSSGLAGRRAIFD